MHREVAEVNGGPTIFTDQRFGNSEDLFLDHYSLTIERSAGANDMIFCGYRFDPETDCITCGIARTRRSLAAGCNATQPATAAELICMNMSAARRMRRWTQWGWQAKRVATVPLHLIHGARRRAAGGCGPYRRGRRGGQRPRRIFRQPLPTHRCVTSTRAAIHTWEPTPGAFANALATAHGRNTSALAWLICTNSALAPRSHIYHAISGQRKNSALPQCQPRPWQSVLGSAEASFRECRRRARRYGRGPPRLFRAALMRGPFTLLSKKMFRHEEKIMGIGIGGRITNPSVQNMHRPCHLRARWEKLWH